jgi:enediyne biosynthesis thioesterase
VRTFEYQHVVGFEETNLVGNVYYVNHLRWQGRCREMFLREHAPGVLKQLEGDLALATVRVSCEYFQEILAFDEITVRMSLTSLAQNRVLMKFEYYREQPDGQQLVARGEQEVASMRREGDRMLPTPIPEEMRAALRRYETAGSTQHHVVIP